MRCEEIWAKTDPFQSVLTHGIVSGLTAQMLIKQYLSENSVQLLCRELHINRDELIDFVGYYVSLHDIGKIGEKFQNPDFSRVIHVRHELTSQYSVQKIFVKKYHLPKRTARILSEILGAHHQGKNGQPESVCGEWEECQNSFETMMAEYFGKGKLIIPELIEEPQGTAEALLLGIVIISDWIASGKLFLEAENWRIGNTLQKKTEERLEQFIQGSGLGNENMSFGLKFSEVWPNIPADGQRELQRLTERIVTDQNSKKKLILIEAPMGEGKTEAAVYAAVQLCHQWGKNGFYIGLPTSATSNQMIQRLEDFFKMHLEEANPSLKLIHGMAWMTEDPEEITYNSEEEKYIIQWLQSSKRTMLIQNAVGTVDQAMLAAMFVKYGILRLLGLAGKVLIIDEIHAYDLYMMNILTGLMSWCRALEIPVILLSATLPDDKKKLLLNVYTDESLDCEYPCITTISDDDSLNTYHIENVAKKTTYQTEIFPYLHQPELIADLALRKISLGGCCCILMNTVAQAQEVYRFLEKTQKDIDLILFHSQFIASQRDFIEKLCIKKYGKNTDLRPKKGILVATQVVEQSLDVDFDFFISAIAPMDLLLQRMGRQYRHQDRERPPMYSMPVFTILVPDDDDYRPDSYVYSESVLLQTRYLLEGIDSVRIPEDVQHLVSDCYDRRKVPENLLERWDKYEEELLENRNKSSVYKLNSPEKTLKYINAKMPFEDAEGQSYLFAKTRLSDASVRIAFVDSDLYQEVSRYCRDGKAYVKNKELARRVMMQSVSVRQKKWLSAQSKITCDYILGEMLLADTVILPYDNNIVSVDEKIGIVWKGEKHE